MSANTESPTAQPVTDTAIGDAPVTRTWYGQVRSAFGKPHIALMSDVQDPATIDHPSQPISSLLGTIPSLRFATPAGCASSPTRHGVNVSTPARRSSGRASTRDDVFFILDGTFDVLISHFGQTPTSSAHCAPATRSASSACSTTCPAPQRFAARRRAHSADSRREHFSTRSKPGPDHRHNGRVDEAALRQLIDDVRSGTVDARRCRRAVAPPAVRRGRRCAGRPPPRPCARACPRRSTAAARASSSASPSSASCWPTVSGRCCSTRADDAQTRGRRRRARPGEQATGAVLWRRPEPHRTSHGAGRQRRHQRCARSSTNAC